jgi:hypothetical protein
MLLITRPIIWLRCWFNEIDEKEITIWRFRKPAEWAEAMERVFIELRRVLKPGGYIAFEVGEVRRGKLKMEELVIPAAKPAKNHTPRSFPQRRVRERSTRRI